MAHVDFDTWLHSQLQEFVGFISGRDVRFDTLDQLRYEAKQIYAADMSSLDRFGAFLRSGGQVDFAGSGKHGSAYPQHGYPGPMGHGAGGHMPSAPPLPVQYASAPPPVYPALGHGGYQPAPQGTHGQGGHYANQAAFALGGGALGAMGGAALTAAMMGHGGHGGHGVGHMGLPGHGKPHKIKNKHKKHKRHHSKSGSSSSDSD